MARPTMLTPSRPSKYSGKQVLSSQHCVAGYVEFEPGVLLLESLEHAVYDRQPGHGRCGAA